MGFNCWGEFTRGKLSLDFPEKDRFDRSQWCPAGRVSTWYMMYRVFVAVVFVAFVICHIIAFPIPEKWIIFMTDQGVLFLTFHFILYASLVLARWIQERRIGVRESSSEGLSLIYKISWAMGSCFSNAALVITSIYWIALHRFVEKYGLLETPWEYFLNFFVHALNSIFCLIDIFLTDRPYRVLHFYVPIGYGLFYVIFSLIYWGAGGTGFCNEDGCVNYIYPILDWSGNPGIAVLTVVLALIVIPIGQCVWFGLYKLRLWIFTKVTSA